jgi:competence CoiA-like predicted nuclease
MLYALIDGIKSNATPNSAALCPFCKSEMIAKCGEFKSWHWAHKRIVDCDTWYKPETEWHRRWKKVFGIANCEIILHKESVRHIADVKTIHGRIIEFQNSPINLETLESREEFYDDMIWIINGNHFSSNFKIMPLNAREYDTYTPEFEFFAKLHGFTPLYKPADHEKRTERFQWKRPKKVWTYAASEVYIDLGGDFLFNIYERTNLSDGTGFRISKRQFIIDNGGDESLLSTILSIEADNEITTNKNQNS